MHRPRFGIALAAVVVVIFLVLFLAFAYQSLVTADLNLGVHAERQLLAQAAANAGIDGACEQLRQNPAWQTGFNNATLVNPAATYTVSFGNGTTPRSTNNLSGTGVVTGFNNRQIPAGTADIIAVGQYGGVQQVEEAMVGSGAPFANGLWVVSTVRLQGHFVLNSFISPTTLLNTGADVVTNDNPHIDPTISLSNNTAIYGSISMPKTGTVSGGGSYETPLQYTATTPTPAPPPPIPLPTPKSTPAAGPGTLQPGWYSSLSGNQTYTLVGGSAAVPTVYVFNSISLGAPGQIEVPSGYVRIFVTGNVSLKGDLDDGQQASHVQMILTKPGSTISFGSNNADIWAVVYAPYSTMDFSGGGSLYGSAVVGSLTMTGGGSDGGLYYDQSLKHFYPFPGGPLVVRQRWQN